jgi:hypothetical protein
MNPNEQMVPENNPVAPPPPPPPAPPAPVQPVYQQPPVQPPAPQPAYVPTSYQNPTSGYFNTLKMLFTDPKSFFDNPPANFVHSLIFPAINLGVMVLVVFLTKIIATLTYSIPTSIYNTDAPTGFARLTADFWGETFKSFGLGFLYAAIFLFAIAGIMMIFALISRKTTTFKDIFAMGSIFSLNFLAVAITSIIGLLIVWITNADFVSIVGLVNNLIISLVFVYAGVLIIQGISTVTAFNFFKSTAIYVLSTILLVFIMGKVIKTFPNDFGISFGQYSNGSSVNLISIDSVLNSSLNSIFN